MWFQQRADICLDLIRCQQLIEDEMPVIFEKNGFTWLGPEWIMEQLNKISQTSYDNKVASVVSKLLLK